MKFDPTKPYGQIYGHSSASFEQGGILFNGAGNPVPVETIIEESEASQTILEAEVIKAFLDKILNGGPVAQANIYKECGLKGYNWSDVKSVAAASNIRMSEVKGKAIWSLN